MKLLFNDSDQHVGGHGAPDLRLHRVLADAQKALDAQVLFDPFEEQLDPGLRRGRLCQRLLYSAAMVNGGSVVLLVKNTSVLPDTGSLYRMRRKCSG